MTNEDPKTNEWLDSYSLHFVDRAGKPVTNRRAEELLKDIEYRTVGFDTFQVKGQKIRVSTVFLGLPHPKDIDSDEEVLYETMIFGGENDQWQHRWKNAAIASKAHEKIVNALKSGEKVPFENTDIISAFFKMLDQEKDEGEEWKE